MNYRKFRRNIKGISPIIATLLLIAIAVVAALVVYAWVMGYVGFQTTTDANSAVIQSVQWTTTGPVATPDSVKTIYLQNVGTGGISFNTAQSVYINGQPLYTSISINGAAAQGGTATGVVVSLPAQGTATITFPTAETVPLFASGSQVTVKIASTGSTYSQATEQAP